MRKVPIVQYLWTWCQSVAPNDVPRDFGPVIAFRVSQGSDNSRQALREKNVDP